jgi:hypothetical protein
MSVVREIADCSCAVGVRSLEGINSIPLLVHCHTYSEVENRKKGDVSR